MGSDLTTNTLCHWQLGSPINPVDLSVEGFRSSKEKLLSMRRGELVEVSKRPIVKNIPFVKESRTHPPAGELLTRRIPAELVGDTLQVQQLILYWQKFYCNFFICLLIFYFQTECFVSSAFFEICILSIFMASLLVMNNIL